MSVPDVVDVLHTQHERIRVLCSGVVAADKADRQQRFAALDEMVDRHERSERAVVHPAVRNSSPSGDHVALACMGEESRIGRLFDDLRASGVARPDFAAHFATLHQALEDHLAHEENDEFPLLRRYVTASRLHMMAGALHDAQVMGVR